MKFVLFVGHGSRDEAGNEEVREFVSRLVKEKHGKYPNTVVCFLEFGSPDISSGIDACVERGATEIVVIPIILLPAGHSKIHIPQAVDAGREKYPQVKFYYGNPVGADNRIIEILNQRIDDALINSVQNEGHSLEVPSDTTAVLLLGRGSSDADANSTLLRISRLLWESRQSQDHSLKKMDLVETAFMGITQPAMREGLDRCRLLGARQIIIVPYFLFTGVLIERMKIHKEDYAREYPELDIHLADYFGLHPVLVDVVERRIDDAVNGYSNLNCDFCKYRTEADASGHHHHSHDHHHNHAHHHDHDHHHAQE